MKYRSTFALPLMGLAVVLLAAGCSTEDAASVDGEASAGGVATLRAALGFDGPIHDVAYLSYVVVPAGEACDAEPLATDTVPLEEEYLPAQLGTSPSFGDMHPFGDALFVLQPGDYTICVLPMTAEERPSEHCFATQGEATVEPGYTTEITLIAQCLGDPSGALDVITGLNDPPHIDDLDILPSKFITTCEQATIVFEASDVNGDELSYDYSLLGAPESASIVAQGSQAIFEADEAGDYEVLATVYDGVGGEASLQFPIHVSFEDCGLSFSGVQKQLPEIDLLDGGFELCHQDTYADVLPDGLLMDQCSGDVLVMACRPTGDALLTVAAMGEYDDVFFDVGDGQFATHPANGVDWYFSDGYSWGFAPEGVGVSRTQCDTNNDQGDERLCWHTLEVGGWRCGSATGLNNNGSWERLVYMRNGDL